MNCNLLNCLLQVNGGIWKTSNLHVSDNTGTTIQWRPLTDIDNVTCSSIGYLNIGLRNKQWLVATCGRPSNYLMGGDLNGGMVSTDGGYSWSMFGPTVPLDVQLTGVVAIGTSTILVSGRCQLTGVTTCSTSLRTKLGIWISLNNGASWSAAIGVPVSEPIWHMDRDPLVFTLIVLCLCFFKICSSLLLFNLITAG